MQMVQQLHRPAILILAQLMEDGVLTVGVLAKEQLVQQKLDHKPEQEPARTQHQAEEEQIVVEVRLLHSHVRMLQSSVGFVARVMPLGQL
jgi:hypothetical protein